ncbi:hypothetical protein D3C76_1290490 [compost metagenome]
MTDENDVIIGNERTAAELAEDLRHALDELGWTPAALMDRMRSLGDYRTPATILRGLNRALEGQIKPSGELMALVQQAVRFQRRLLRTYGDTVWTQLGDGSHTAQLEDFTITLVPQSKGRWLVTMVHKGGLRPKWPRWQESLEAAKHMAFVTLDDGQNQLRELAEEKAREAAEQL